LSTGDYSSDGLVVVGPTVAEVDGSPELRLTVEHDPAPGVRAVISFRAVNDGPVEIYEIMVSAVSADAEVSRTNLHHVRITDARRAAMLTIEAVTGDAGLAMTALLGRMGADPIDEMTLLQHAEAFVAASRKDPNNPYVHMPIADQPFQNARWTALARNTGLLTAHPLRELTAKARKLRGPDTDT
jgi:hypothetical protein